MAPCKCHRGSLLGVQRSPATGRGIPGRPPQAFPPCPLQRGLGPAPLDTRRQMLLARDRAGMHQTAGQSRARRPLPAASLHSTRDTAAPKRTCRSFVCPKCRSSATGTRPSLKLVLRICVVCPSSDLLASPLPLPPQRRDGGKISPCACPPRAPWHFSLCVCPRAHRALVRSGSAP